ncbi:Sporangia Induced Dynein Regulatory Complex Protein [Achlya hypogyna]|uniref:Sporangia Induced Dynein Regulatory Complex Protein n=1 Tax=Achlya hypogyna TaxID=1202772 RepID=A0A1V9YDX4_ACHHY|nr:Sporangia Induced Dynein Regulatory Complex Protein [Achlya hypogyna]
MAKKKKGKKGKKEEEAPPEEPSEYDTMDIEMLKEVTQMLRQQLDKSQVDRNYVQHERDTIQSFYDITKREVETHDMEIMAKDREMEMMEDNHRVEVRVYIQKVKHLEYEHKNNVKRVKTDGYSHIDEEKDMHIHREHKLKGAKQALKLELKERELSNEDEIEQMKQSHEKNLLKLREQFEKNNAALEERLQERLAQLQEDLELRRKVDIHEIEERKNLHINDLMKNHERAFTQMKNYYNDITKDNLRLIESLKREIAEMKKKAAANTKLMHDISHENKRLSEPLAAAVQEVERLKHELKDEQKDKLSLRNAKARLVLLGKQRVQLKKEHQELLQAYKALEANRNALYDSFEHTIHTVQTKGEYKNLVLEQRLSTFGEQHDKKQAQLDEILQAASLEAGEVRRVTEKLDGMLTSKNSKMRDLQYQVAKASKAYNDALRTYEAKMADLGIPDEDIRTLGFNPLLTTTSVGPAGLVAK